MNDAVIKHPSWRFLWAHPAHFIACGLGSGLVRVAPGTAGTLLAWLTYPLWRMVYPQDLNFGLLTVLLFVFGIWCCQITGRDLGTPDHGAIVWDEMVPFWMVLFIAPTGWLWQCTAFASFRLFDIVKPAPARWFDTRMKNGVGVMMDDLIAAAYTLLTLALLQTIVNVFV
jgi:phosphatidylglycerophosphatase A